MFAFDAARAKKGTPHIDLDATLYHEFSSLQETVARRVIDHIQFESRATVLDVGCGDGKITAHIARDRVPEGKVLGIDASENMINFAKAHYGPSMYPNLQFKKCDARAMTFDDRFDFIVSFFCLHWIDRQQDVLRQMKKRLRDGGQCIATLNSYTMDRSLVNTVLRRKKWRPYFRKLGEWVWLPKVDQFSEMLHSAGFKKVNIESSALVFQDKEREKFISRLMSVSPLTRFLPVSSRRSFIGEIVDELLEKEGHSFSEGPLVIERPIIVATAVAAD